MKKLLLFGAPVFQIPVIEKAKQMGLYVGVVDINPEALAVPYADEYFCCSLKNKDRLLDIAKEFQPDGIMAGACDTSVVSVAYVCEKLGLPGLPQRVAETATDKLKMLEAFERNHVPHPIYQIVRHGETITDSILIPFPAISKPVNSSGSRGVAYISNKEDIQAALERSFSAAQEGDILLEEYLSGPEVSVEAAVIHGKPYVLQITDKITSGAPYFFETGHSQPSMLDPKSLAEISSVAKRAILAVGLVNSTAHVEIKLTESGPKMIELGARLGGGCISTYLLETSVDGASLTEIAIHIALGDTLEEPQYRNSGKYAAVRFLVPEQGTIKSVSGIDDVAKFAGLVKVLFFGNIGQRYAISTKNADRIGFVVAKGESKQEAFSQCDKALAFIHITYS